VRFSIARFPSDESLLAFAGARPFSPKALSGIAARDARPRIRQSLEKYVDGRVHTNGIENFWSLLKRGLKGTYIAVGPFHPFRYLDEQLSATIAEKITKDKS
jgi:hypothetical protein